MPDLTGALSGCHAVVAQLSAQRPIARKVDPASQRHGIEPGVRHPMHNETFRFFTAARSPSSRCRRLRMDLTDLSRSHSSV